jgi:O-acetylhomoserine/O-acetylserine sulfhydrylase-like pyridoxal-dependent enzyme
MTLDRPRRGFRTRAVPAGEAPDPATRASAPNIVMSTTFVVDDADAQFSANALAADPGAPRELSRDR